MTAVDALMAHNVELTFNLLSKLPRISRMRVVPGENVIPSEEYELGLYSILGGTEPGRSGEGCQLEKAGR